MIIFILFDLVLDFYLLIFILVISGMYDVYIWKSTISAKCESSKFYFQIKLFFFHRYLSEMSSNQQIDQFQKLLRQYRPGKISEDEGFCCWNGHQQMNETQHLGNWKVTTNHILNMCPQEITQNSRLRFIILTSFRILKTRQLKTLRWGKGAEGEPGGLPFPRKFTRF